MRANSRFVVNIHHGLQTKLVVQLWTTVLTVVNTGFPVKRRIIAELSFWDLAFFRFRLKIKCIAFLMKLLACLQVV